MTVIRKPKYWRRKISVSLAVNSSFTVDIRSILHKYVCSYSDIKFSQLKYMELKKGRDKGSKTHKADPFA